MKKLLVLLFAFTVVFSLATQSVLAGGDKVRGDKGDGSVCQYQNVVYGDPAFDGDGRDE
jgi:hypothetical protein